MAKNWIQNAIKKPGALKKELGVPAGKTIPAQTTANGYYIYTFTASGSITF